MAKLTKVNLPTKHLEIDDVEEEDLVDIDYLDEDERHVIIDDDDDEDWEDDEDEDRPRRPLTVKQKKYIMIGAGSLAAILVLVIGGFFLFGPKADANQQEGVTQSSPTGALSWTEIDRQPLYAVINDADGTPMLKTTMVATVEDETVDLSFISATPMVDEARLQAAGFKLDPATEAPSLSATLLDPNSSGTITFDVTPYINLIVSAQGKDPNDPTLLAWAEDDISTMEATPTKDGLSLLWDIETLAKTYASLPEDQKANTWGYATLMYYAPLAQVDLYLDDKMAEEDPQDFGQDFASLNVGEVPTSEPDGSYPSTTSPDTTTDDTTTQEEQGETPDVTFTDGGIILKGGMNSFKITLSAKDAAKGLPIHIADLEATLQSGLDTSLTFYELEYTVLSGNPTIEPGTNGGYDITAMSAGDVIEINHRIGIAPVSPKIESQITVPVYDASGSPLTADPLPIEVIG